MLVTIDPSSGFCFGVKKAVEQAEILLEKGEKLYCLGDLVHNRAEMERLGKLGLVTLDHKKISSIRYSKVLFRAHGEPPESYRLIAGNDLPLTDATCPIVKKLQDRVKSAWDEMKKQGGQVVIFGNPGHPETIGLRGQTNGGSIICSGPGDVSAIDPSRPVVLFSQTTKDESDFRQLENNIRKLMGPFFSGRELPLRVHNTICGQISGRAPKIRAFAKQHEVVVFVGGARSSNAKVLYRHCLNANPKSHFVESSRQVLREWFRNARSAGVCGATSTPVWLLSEVAGKIKELTADNYPPPGNE